MHYYDDDLSNQNDPYTVVELEVGREITELKTKRSKSENCDWEKLETPITGSALKMQFLSTFTYLNGTFFEPSEHGHIHCIQWTLIKDEYCVKTFLHL